MLKDKIEEIKKKALEEKVPIIMDDTLDVMSKYLLELKPKNILEIGAAVGYSSIRFASLLGEKCLIDTIERNEERANEARKNITETGLNNIINLYEGDALEILPKLNNKYDAIFIDAAKGKYPFFLKESLRLLNSNGIIFADNVLYKGYVLGEYNEHKHRTAVRNLREFIKDATDDSDLDTKILEVGDGLAIIKKIN